MTNTEIIYARTRPEFAITVIGGSSRNCYHETIYEIVSEVELDADDLKRLADCGLLGFGQAYYLEKTDTLTDTVPPVTRDRTTGVLLPDVPPLAYNGQPLTNTVDYTYHVYHVKRICDSGD